MFLDLPFIFTAHSNEPGYSNQHTVAEEMWLIKSGIDIAILRLCYTANTGVQCSIDILDLT